ncbi:uncharacterized protein LOC110100644 [Dendrobium catenatum]|uniref:uncharacterized protein LOC110100644 n=1 Tax=Dendrobium catenatum TaxID=906689 RepID=UPI00109FC185|nr:uncharacterized protein LOC110100644 [Dendrobium catenatum]
MWGRFYWLRKEEGGRRAGGIVVLFAWLSSQESHLKPYVDLYWSLGWDCLVCHVDFLTQFFPEKATELAIGIVGELIKEVKIRPMPIVLAAFSAGSKGYFFKVLQLVEGKCAGQHNQDDFLLLRDCISGQIYDSCPVDFTNDLGLQFVLHSSVLKMSYPPRVVSCMAKAFASGLDALFLNSFEAQRAEYWQTLYSSVSMGPFIILCSEDDKLAPYQTLYSFAQCLQELGADVNLIKWSSSPHVAHYRHHQDEYKATGSGSRRGSVGAGDWRGSGSRSAEAERDRDRRLELQLGSERGFRARGDRESGTREEQREGRALGQYLTKSLDSRSRRTSRISGKRRESSDFNRISGGIRGFDSPRCAMLQLDLRDFGRAGSDTRFSRISCGIHGMSGQLCITGNLEEV